jgi:glutaminyl-peptide cyclotransferase
LTLRGGTIIARIRLASTLLLLLSLLVAAALAVGPTSAPAQAQSGTAPPGLLTRYEVVGSTPHDPNAFLQGLVWHDGGFYESTGLNGQSTLRRVAYPSGEVLKRVDVPREYFAEGLALVDNRLLQLTWRHKKAFVYDRESFGLLGELGYETEGWGLTYDGTSLILSDGSDTLFFLDPNTFQVVRMVAVTLDGRALPRLNELEWIKGEIWSNVWMTDMIVRIDPASGQVVGVLDMTGLLQPPSRDRDNVLNGIAYDPDGDRTFVSGKRWPLMFEIRVTQ